MQRLLGHLKLSCITLWIHDTRRMSAAIELHSTQSESKRNGSYKKSFCPSGKDRWLQQEKRPATWTVPVCDTSLKRVGEKCWPKDGRHKWATKARRRARHTATAVWFTCVCTLEALSDVLTPRRTAHWDWTGEWVRGGWAEPALSLLESEFIWAQERAKLVYDD